MHMQVKNLELKNSPLQKVLVIIGPTASGKTALAIRLARKFGGEIVSADSRQVYRGMDIGTGKTPRDTNAKIKYEKITDARSRTAGNSSRRRNIRPEIGLPSGLSPPLRAGLAFIPTAERRGILPEIIKPQPDDQDCGIYVSRGVAHHLIDIAWPKRQFTVARFQKLARKAISGIVRRGKLPIVCGGTGHYIDALIFGQRLPNVVPNRRLRARLAKKSVPELYRMLKKFDPRRASSIDKKNPRRLVRAVEIVLTTGKPVPPQTAMGKKHAETVYDALWLGLDPSQKKLHRSIRDRLYARMRQGMIGEVRRLKKQGISSPRLEALGLEYRYINRYLYGLIRANKRITKKEMCARLEREIRRYAKRQMTWFRRNKRIHW